MSKQHGARQQKKLAKQKAKKESKRKEVARRNSPDPNVRLRMADAWPVLVCLVPKYLWESGMGSLMIARRTHDGHVAVAFFLLDIFCLGVKDAFWKIIPLGEFEEMRENFETDQGPHDRPTPEYFAKLVYRTADYGQSLGFPPHHEFRHAQRLLAGIDPSLCPDEFTFGKDGQPSYIPGPNDSIEKINFVMARLSSKNGRIGFPPGMLTSPEMMDQLAPPEDEEDADEE